MTKDESSTLLDRQKLMIGRLYDKIDHLKAARLRIPSYVAVANFGFLALSTRAKVDDNTALIFVLGFAIIGMIGLYALYVVRSAFSTNVEQLDYLYDKIEVKTPDFLAQKLGTNSLAEPASPLWSLLFFLIIVAVVLPTVLILFVDFVPIPPKI